MTSESVADTAFYYLSIASVTEDDMDNYTCEVEYAQGTQVSQPAALTIRGLFNVFYSITIVYVTDLKVV